jgi:pilus assembly protein CpaB
MNTARIVVLIIALSAGGVAAYLMRGYDSSDKPAAAEPVAQLPTVDVLVAKSDIPLGQAVTRKLQPQRATTLAARSAGTLSLALALRSIADVNAIEIAPSDQLNMRGSGVNVIRYGVASQTTTQK